MSEKSIAERLRNIKATDDFSCIQMTMLGAAFGDSECPDGVSCGNCLGACMSRIADEIDDEKGELIESIRKLRLELFETRKLKAYDFGVYDGDGTWTYRFPELAQIPVPDVQMAKIAEETVEVHQALLARDYEAAAMEAMDVIHASETLLRRLSEVFGVNLNWTYEKVVAGNRERGYYGKEE